MGAWIETCHRNKERTESGKSHPMWVRGLKRQMCEEKHFNLVAPYVGAWIETSTGSQCVSDDASRTLCGCVD